MERTDAELETASGRSFPVVCTERTDVELE